MKGVIAVIAGALKWVSPGCIPFSDSVLVFKKIHRHPAHSLRSHFWLPVIQY